MNTMLIYTGIKRLALGEQEEIFLADGLKLVKPNPLLLSGRMRYAQSEREYDEAEEASHYLVYSYEDFPVVRGREEPKDHNAMFYGSLMALQIVKPVCTLGFVYRGTHYGEDSMHTAIEHMPPMHVGEWASRKTFDRACLSEAIAFIPRVQAALTGASVPEKNAITALQLGLETYAYHQYIAGLLWVIGMEAIFDSESKNDFSDKLCKLLGADTRVFPDWNNVPNPPHWTVKGIALDLYMFRSKLAHGVDLRQAAQDKKTPVDLLKMVQLHGYSQERSHARVLCEAACYLLCRVIQLSI
ncbi:hypothetical protein [Silvibacterium dinghuense]|uniref:Apea-like HEPN domain-containing protein n=1 Tax=Silvibacterium dinghuense TaxID=1560006 RepID=A0A4Q1SJV3_9BACT|nr:hypothetical protein [Silvibacterium dinghuense]RXS97723.1 hypothetical protein ESZ00_07590 [Silvibacterium dinghuense]GGH01447.1 hypothetical protein GCM10011586_16380 [Silvibacterium dinghuense]